jgi:hypothetical protein
VPASPLSWGALGIRCVAASQYAPTPKALTTEEFFGRGKDGPGPGIAFEGCGGRPLFGAARASAGRETKTRSPLDPKTRYLTLIE